MNYSGKSGLAALFMGAEKPFELKEYPLTDPAEGYALLRLSASGICGTDVHIHRGRLAQPSPLIIGHEFLGTVMDVNCVNSAVKVGDRVIFNMAEPCGKCKLCKAGDSANCLNLNVAYAQNPENPPHFFGGYAQYCYARAGVNDGALVKIPDGVDTLAAAMFPCAGPTIIHALKLGGVFGDVSQIETAVVQGGGPLGLFSALWLTAAGVPKVYAVLRHTDGQRADDLRLLTKAEVISDVGLDDLTAKGFTADLCVECSGNPNAFAQGCAVLRNRGIYLVPGQYSDSGNISFGPQIITFKALRVIGSSQYDSSDVADYITFLSDRRELSPSLAACVKTYPVAEINTAVEAAEKHLYAKVALV